MSSKKTRGVTLGRSRVSSKKAPAGSYYDLPQTSLASDDVSDNKVVKASSQRTRFAVAASIILAVVLAVTSLTGHGLTDLASFSACPAPTTNKPYIRKGPPVNATAVNEMVAAFMAYPRRTTPYKAAACTLVTSDSRYLLEWAIYHHLIGFEQLYIYDNADASENVESIILPLVQRGLVTYIKWPGAPTEAQSKFISHCFNEGTYSGKTNWLTWLEIEDFVVAKGGRPSAATFLGKEKFALHDFLSRAMNAKCGGVMIDRLMFGASGRNDPANGLVISDYTERHVVEYVEPGNPIIVPSRLEKMPWMHDFIPTADYHRCTGDFKFVDYENGVAPARPYQVFEPVSVFHHQTRSYSECVARLARLTKCCPDDWRVKNGVALCDRFMKGKEGYDPDKFFEDRSLANAIYPHVIAKLLKPETGFLADSGTATAKLS